MTEVALLTDEQFKLLLGALVTAFGAAGFGFRWAVNRLTTALDASTGARIQAATAEATLAVTVGALRDDVADVHAHWLGRAQTTTPKGAS